MYNDVSRRTFIQAATAATVGMTVSGAGVITWTPDFLQAERPNPTVTVTVSATSVTREGGSDRFWVAANLARAGWDPANTKSWAGVHHVIVANGENGKEADPLCGAGLAGVYDDRQEPHFMIRTRIPGGELSADQMEAIAGVVRDFAVKPEGEDGPERFGEITTRQDVQIHWIRFEDLPEIWSRYEAAWITTSHACGDALRKWFLYETNTTRAGATTRAARSSARAASGAASPAAASPASTSGAAPGAAIRATRQGDGHRRDAERGDREGNLRRAAGGERGDPLTRVLFRSVLVQGGGVQAGQEILEYIRIRKSELSSGGEPHGLLASDRERRVNAVQCHPIDQLFPLLPVVPGQRITEATVI